MSAIDLEVSGAYNSLSVGVMLPASETLVVTFLS
jgi:hypothetical protein